MSRGSDEAQIEGQRRAQAAADATGRSFAPPTERSCTCGPDGSGTCEAHVWVEPAGKCICTTEHYDTNCPVHSCTEDKCRRGHGGNQCPVAYTAEPFPPSTRGNQVNVGISPRALFIRGFWTGIDRRDADDLHASLADALKKEGL